MGKFKDLTGQTYGRLVVIKRVEDYISPKGYCEPQWLCECSCVKHKQIIVRRSSLKSGLVKSCGCLRIESTSINNKQKRKINEYNLSGEYGVGYCSNTGNEFYFDLEDYDKIKDYCWREHTGKTGAKTLVAYDCKSKKQIKMTTLLGLTNYDHENRNRLDNRKINLRHASKNDNARNHNKYANNTSGFTGVSWRKDKQMWSAYIIIDGKQNHIGYFINKEDAIIARLKAEAKHFGLYFAPQRHLFEKYKIITKEFLYDGKD